MTGLLLPERSVGSYLREAEYGLEVALHDHAREYLGRQLQQAHYRWEILLLLSRVSHRGFALLLSRRVGRQLHGVCRQEVV